MSFGTVRIGPGVGGTAIATHQTQSDGLPPSMEKWDTHHIRQWAQEHGLIKALAGARNGGARTLVERLRGAFKARQENAKKLAAGVDASHVEDPDEAEADGGVGKQIED